MNKQILVFVNGELFKQITYRTKREAKNNYNLFKKAGIMVLTANGCEILRDAVFELI